MKEKINLGLLIREAIIQNMPSCAEEAEFLEKYILPDNNVELEDAVNEVVFAAEKRAFRAGFRTAVSLVQGKMEVDINELIKKAPSPEEWDMETVLHKAL